MLLVFCFPLSREDKKEEFNEGLLVQEHKADARYGIFDKDFSIYQYIKNYKAVLYSKRNKDYCNRTKLSEGELTPWMDYIFNSNEIFMRYRYLMEKGFLRVEMEIDIEKTVCLARGNVSARVEWYDNDITSCILQRHVDTGILMKDLFYEAEERTGKVFTRNYYMPGEYSDKIQQYENLGKVNLSIQKNDNKMNIQFLFPAELSIFFGVSQEMG